MNCDKYSILKQYFGHDSFRPGQEEIIDSIISGRDALGIMPTGAGKSVCYQTPALMADGITVVISPLISLMKEQVGALIQSGVRAAYFNSSLTYGQYLKALSNAEKGVYKIIYAAPERLTTKMFLDMCAKVKISLVAVDEAHCVSQWGQDFRPSYLKIAEFMEKLPYRPVMAAFTATATREVKEDIIRILKLKNPVTVTTGFDRPNLYFSVVAGKEKSAELLDFLKDKKDMCGIVYCSTRKTAEEVCEFLNKHSYAATRYHAGLDDAERRKNREDFVYDRKNIMVATNAFGMGIDKSNVRFVVHYNMPKNIESYYQEAGRAGRDGEKAECMLMYSPQDVRINRFLIENSEPNPELDEKTQAEVREKELDGLKYMTFYSTGKTCLRSYILRYFGERGPGSCGNCSNCRAKISRRAENVYTEEKLYNVDGELLTELKALRKKLAARSGVPAYVVFSDSSLVDMCRKLPSTKEEFIRVSGVGAVKAERYGDDFIKVIRRRKKE